MPMIGLLRFRIGAAVFVFWAALLWFGSDARAFSPEGLWRTFHPDSGLPRSEVRLEIDRGVLRGRIERVLLPSDKEYPYCGWCPDELKNAPFLGMTILRGLRPSPSDPRSWSGGKVLDPDSGRVFDARIRLKSDGRSLELRGFSGSEIFGRSEIWRRVQDAAGKR